MKPNGDETTDSQREDPVEPPYYEPPGIEWEEQLTTVARFAAACARLPLSDPSCDLGGSKLS